MIYLHTHLAADFSSYFQVMDETVWLLFIRQFFQSVQRQEMRGRGGFCINNQEQMKVAEIHMLLR